VENQYARKLLDIYIESVWRILHGRFGCDRAETAMFAAIDFVREEEGLRSYFLQRVREALSDSDGLGGAGADGMPRELVLLAIHELRWPEFHDLIEMRRSQFPRDLFFHSLLAAFKPDWEDREFYQRYSVA